MGGLKSGVVAAVALCLSSGSAGHAQETGSPEFNLPDLIERAEQGNANAQFFLGTIYDFGLYGEPENDAEAVRWFHKAADQGHVGAQFHLGHVHDNGEGVPENDAEAVRWYRLAAEQGDGVAQFNLGVMYANGEGVPENDAEAARWYRLAAEQGYPKAQSNLGDMYFFGYGVPTNWAEAVRWWRKAAEQGHASAQHNIGVMYENGWGVPENDAEAVRWYRLAAEQGNASAQNNLGLMYDNGEGVPESDAEAVRLYRLAAEQGYADAQHNLGLMHGKGEGVPESYIEAYFWFILAAAQGNDEAASGAEIVREQLTRAQIAEVQARAAAWQPEKDRSAPAAVPAPPRAATPSPQPQTPVASDLVLVLQEGLSILGYYDGAIDGLAGPATRAAIEAFQRDNDLAVTGQVSAELVYFVAAASGAVLASQADTQEESALTGATGSGFFISAQGHVVTNAHVVTGCRAIRFGDGSVALLKAFEPSSDLALLQAAGARDVAPLSLRAGRGIRLGDDTLVAGYPLSDFLTSALNVTTGTVSALSGPGSDRRLFQLTAPVQAGNSGGPVLDSAGHVVGVVVSKLDAVAVFGSTGDLPQNVNFAISKGLLQSFLDSHAVDYATGTSTAQLANADIAERARQATVQVICEAE